MIPIVNDARRSALVRTLAAFVWDVERWEGRTADLLNHMKTYATPAELDIWPGAVSSCAQILVKAGDEIKAEGITAYRARRAEGMRWYVHL